jgi:hypothetical protein
MVVKYSSNALFYKKIIQIKPYQIKIHQPFNIKLKLRLNKKKISHILTLVDSSLE